MYDEHEKKVMDFFDVELDNIDAIIEAVVPKLKEIREQALDSVPKAPNEAFKLLDLGVGTGTELIPFLRKFREMQVTAVDGSISMLDRARDNLRGFKDRVELIHDNYITMDYPSGFDVVLSMQSIHNHKDENKRKIFRKIAQCLNPKGAFVNADMVKMETPDLDAKVLQTHIENLKKNLSGLELALWTEHVAETDKLVKFRTQKQWLLEEGFKDVEMTWQNFKFSVYVATK